MKKQLFSCIFAVFLAASLSVPALAESTTEVNNKPSAEGGNSTVVIEGNISPTLLTANITLSSAFSILPNEADKAKRFVTPEISVENTSTVPINVKMLSFKPTADAPQIVKQDTYTDQQWERLGLADSKSKIALGLTSGIDTDFWLKLVSEDQSQALKHLYAGESFKTKLQAKHGLTWDQSYTYIYDMVLELSLDA